MIIIDSQGLRSVQAVDTSRRALCIFEFIYFARPDSAINGRLVYQVRQEMGGTLAREHPVDADLVIPVPDSAIPAAKASQTNPVYPLARG